MTDPIRERAARAANAAAFDACPHVVFLGQVEGVNKPITSRARPAWVQHLVMAIAIAAMLVAGVGIYRALVLADRQIEIAERV